MGTSLVYWNPRVYELTMRVLYGRYYQERYKAISRLIPDQARVLDVCCGPAFLYERFLRSRGVDYTGLDLNPAFARRVERLGGRGMVCDLMDGALLPTSEYVVMHASLYQFLPHAGVVANRLIAAATVGVVLAEPVRNLATSGLPGLAAFARLATNAGQGTRPLRFTERMLDDLVATLPVPLLRSFLIPGGREKVYLLAAAGQREEPQFAPLFSAQVGDAAP